MNVGDLFVKIFCDTSEFDKGLSATKSKLSSFGSMMGSAFGTVAKVGAAALGAATTAVTAFGASSVKTGMSFDSAMSQVAATMGKTVAEMQKETGSANTSFGQFNGTLREFAQFLGANTAFSATQAAEALNYMALAGYNTQESMDMLPNVLSLAAAGGFDLARASDMVTDTQTAFGISAERTTQMVDEMAKAASTGNTNVEQLGDAFLVVGGLAKELNGGMVTLKDGTTKSVDGIQELEIALTAMANAGVKGSEAGTHMRNMLLKLSSPTKEGTKALEQMGVKVFDTEGRMRSLSDVFGDLNTKLGEMTQEQKIGVISELFNTRDMAAAEAMLAAVNQDWDEIGESILNARGAAAQMAETQLDNLNGDITIFKSALEGAKINISDGLSPALRDFVQLGTKGVSALGDMFKQFNAQPYLDEMGRMNEEGARAQAEIKQRREEAVGELFQTITDGVGMVVNMLPQMVDAGEKLLVAIGTGLMSNINVLIDAAVEIIVQFSLGLIQAIPKLIEAAGQLIEGLARGFSEHSEELKTAGLNLLTFIWEGLKTGLPKMLDAAADIILNLSQGLGSALPELVPEAVEMILTIVTGITNNLDKLVDAAVAIIVGLAEGLIAALPNLISSLPQIIEGIIRGLIELAVKMAEVGPVLIADLIHGIIAALPELLQAGVELMIALVGGIKQAFTDVKAAGQEAINQVWEGIKSLDPIQWGKDLINGFVEGIKGGISFLTEAGNGAAEAISKLLHFSVPDEGPLADADTYMPDMMQLFAEGISTNGQQIITALTNVLTTVQQGIINFSSQAVLNITTTLTNIFTTVSTYCLQFIDTANRTLSDILNKVITWMSQIPPKMVYYITTAVNGFMNILNQLPGKVASVLQNIINRVIEFGTNLVNKAIQIAKNFADALINGIKDLPSRFAEVGSNIVQGLWNGISSGWSWLTDQVKSLANSLLEAAKDALDIESPSKKFYWIGEMVDEGFAKGINDNSYKIDRAMTDILDVTENVPEVSSSIPANQNRGGFTQYVNITSPVALTPYEVARQTRNATRDLVLAMSGV